jgi:hypothetical protein
LSIPEQPPVGPDLRDVINFRISELSRFRLEDRTAPVEHAAAKPQSDLLILLASRTLDMTS